jgi:hypothetical protein
MLLHRRTITMHFRVCINYNKYMYVYNNAYREEHLKTSKASAVFVSWALIYSNTVYANSPKYQRQKSVSKYNEILSSIHIFFSCCIVCTPQLQVTVLQKAGDKKQLFCITVIIIQYMSLTISLFPALHFN